MWPVREERRRQRRDGNMVTLPKCAKEKGMDDLHTCEYEEEMWWFISGRKGVSGCTSG